MKKTQKERLKKAGWKVGTAKEFLGLTDDEAALIEMKCCRAGCASRNKHTRPD